MTLDHIRDHKTNSRKKKTELKLKNTLLNKPGIKENAQQKFLKIHIELNENKNTCCCLSNDEKETYSIKCLHEK